MLAAAILSFVCTWASGVILVELLGPVIDDTGFYNASFGIKWITGFLLLLIFFLAGWVMYYNREQYEEHKRRDELNSIARETELNNLRQQLQPHFIFNTLNSISALAATNSEGSRKMIQQLSDFLRGTLKNEKHEWVSLQHELEHLQLYLSIEEVRFGNRLKTEIHCDEGVEKMMLPPLLLQPLVENAIKFGLYDTLGAVTITFHASRQGQNLALSLTNPFEGTVNHKSKGTGFGLTSAKRKLYLLYGRNDLLQVKTDEGQFTVNVTIPQPA